MKRILIKLEAGGTWHPFVMEADNHLECVGRLYDLGVPMEAHWGYRNARSDDKHLEPTRDDIVRLEALGWTKHGEPVDFRAGVTLSLTRELRARGVGSIVRFEFNEYVVSWAGENDQMSVILEKDRVSIDIALSVVNSLKGISEGESSAGSARALMLLFKLAITAKQNRPKEV